MNKKISSISGFLAGIINGLLGAGGGMIIVPMLSRAGLEQNKAHATSVCVILPICIFSTCVYLFSGRISLSETVPYIVWGLIGSIMGSYFLTKINPMLLKRIFGIILIWGAYRMIFR